KFRDFSPAHQISQDDPPTLVMLGTKDPLIAVKTAERFRDEMKKLGVRCDTLLYDDQVHGFFNKEPWLGRTNEKCGEFLRSLDWFKNMRQR
ncbi:MAG TPA: lipase, partial [Verrucomicrobiales bacterium]|nr:lipase [Verrucomicrobiales bacterium]